MQQRRRPASRKKIAMVEYISLSNPEAARKLVVAQFGLTPARDRDELVMKLHHIIKHHKKEGLKAIAAIHPDRELIIDMSKDDIIGDAAGGNSDYSYSNIVTNYRSDMPDFRNAEGEDPAKKASNVLRIAGILSLVAIAGIILSE